MGAGAAIQILWFVAQRRVYSSYITPSTSHLMRFRPNLAVFARTKPAERVGNLLIYRGSFPLPWLWQNSLTARAIRILHSPNPDMGKAEAYLRRALDFNPGHFPALLQLGNIMLGGGRRAEAIAFYERARNQTAISTPVHGALTRQIDRLAGNEPLEQIREIRDTRSE